MEFEKVTKKPIEVEAVELTESIWSCIIQGNSYIIINSRKLFAKNENGIKIFIVETLEGNMKANIGDYLIKGINKEIYPCRKDIFKKNL